MNKFSLVQVLIYCEASMTFSGFPNSNIDKACKGIKKTCFGYKWMYLKDYEKIKG